MNYQNDHRRAPLPSSEYARPAAIDSAGLNVTVFGEDGSKFGTFNFENLEAPQQLVKELVAGFSKASSSEGRWKTKATITEAASILRQFATSIAKTYPKLKSIAALTPEMWWAWRSELEKRARWPGKINLTRALLYEVEALQDSTRHALKQRTKKPKKRSYSAYSEPEFRRIRATAWRVVRRARQRIRSNLMYLERYRQGNEPDIPTPVTIQGTTWTKGKILEHLARTGQFPKLKALRHHLCKFQRLLGINTYVEFYHAIFPTAVEIYAVMILFVCERGYNTCVIDALKADPHRADSYQDEQSIHVVNLDKPRRGPNRRYFNNSLSGKAARLMRITEEITQPARDALEALGKPSESLLVARISGGRSSDGTIFRTDWSQAYTVSTTWHSHFKIASDKGPPLRVTLQRLRLTEQVINQRARQNSDHVSELIYRAQDPQTHEMAISVILQGQQDAIADATAVLAVKNITREEFALAKKDPSTLAKELGVSRARVKQLLAGKLDTATTACTEFNNSPYSEKGTPCPASFLACLGCPNAVSTPDHLPRLVALYDALIDIASAVEQTVWENDYRVAFMRLKSLLAEKATDAEISHARACVSLTDRDKISSLLQRGLDA